MPAPSINIKQARSPGNVPGTAPFGVRITGPRSCMTNTAFDAHVARCRNSAANKSWSFRDNSRKEDALKARSQNGNFQRSLL
jgi:hypothetical protein